MCVSGVGEQHWNLWEAKTNLGLKEWVGPPLGAMLPRLVLVCGPHAHGAAFGE